MNIVVAQISENEGLDVHHLYPDGEPGLIGRDGHLLGQTEVSLQATRAGQKIVVIKNVTLNEPFFQGHFPGLPIMPGVLQIEAIAQAAGR